MKNTKETTTFCRIYPSDLAIVDDIAKAIGARSRAEAFQAIVNAVGLKEYLADEVEAPEKNQERNRATNGKKSKKARGAKNTNQKRRLPETTHSRT